MKQISFILAAAALAAPAHAAVWSFGGSAGTATSYTATLTSVPTLAGPLANVSFTAQARRFTPLPSMLTNISQLIPTTTSSTPLLVDRNATGIGVVGGANTQLDTNNPGQYEAIYLSFDNMVRLRGLTLSVIDANDTLQVYGVTRSTGALVNLGFDGRIATGLAGAATFSNAGTTNNFTTTLSFVNQSMNFFSGYVLTTRNAGNILTDGDLGQGYRIDSFNGIVLPEPGSWALMIIGFGLTGAMMRRKAAALATG